MFLDDLQQQLLNIVGNLSVIVSIVQKEAVSRRNSIIPTSIKKVASIVSKNEDKSEAIEKLNNYFKEQITKHRGLRDGGEMNLKMHDGKKKNKQETIGGKGKNIMQKGSISKRSDGRYMGRYYADGKAKCVYARTLKDVTQKLRDAISTLEKGNKTSPKAFTTDQWFNTWINVYKKPKNKESTIILYQEFYKRIIQPVFGQKIIAKITSVELQNFINNIVGVTNKKMAVIILSDMFKKMHDNGYVLKNAMSLVVLSKDNEVFQTANEINNQVDKVLSLEDEDKLFGSSVSEKEKPIKEFMQFLLYSGLRIGEALALTVGDVDYDNKKIIINKQFNNTSKKISTPKSQTSNRIIPFFDKVQELFEEMGIDFADKTSRLFKNVKMSNAVVSSVINFAKKRGVILSSKTFRKTFSSRCQFEYDIPQKVVKEWLGHSNTAVTDNYYTFADKQLFQDSIDKINAKSKKN